MIPSEASAPMNQYVLDVRNSIMTFGDSIPVFTSISVH
jgi:hypothetical protein